MSDLKPETLDTENVGRRPLSVRLLSIIVLSTISLVGAVFTAGSTWGGSTSKDDSAIEALRVGLAANVAAVAANEARLSLVEGLKTQLAPSVDRLSVQTEKLAEAVVLMRENLAAQTVEVRNLKDSIVELRAKVK